MKSVSHNFKYFAVAVGIVFVWRGVWGLADIYLFPNNPTLSFITSIAIGLVILLVIDWHKKDVSELG